MDHAALVEMFRARIAEVLEAARAYLEASPDRLTLLIAVERGSLEDDHADRVALDSQRRVALEMPRPSYFAADNATAAAWPPRGAFRPGTTYAEALADVSREVDAYAIDRADNLVTVVDDLVAPDLRAEVLSDPVLPRQWPLGYEVNPVLVAPLFQALTRIAHTAGLPPAERLSRPRVPARVIAEWAREGINAAYRRDMERMRRGGHHPVTFADSEGPGDDLVRWAVERDRLEPVVFGYTRIDSDSLWLVYHAHQSARWRLQPRYAAGLAHGWTLGLVTTEDPSLPFTDALRRVYIRACEEAGEAPVDPLLTLALGEKADLQGRLRLLGELVVEARRMVRPITDGDPSVSIEAARPVVDGPYGPMLQWDARFADVLEAVGPMGRDRAEGIRKAAAERLAATDAPAGALWALWYELDDIGPPRWLRTLARVLWADRWRPELEHQHRPVALTLTAMSAIDRVLSARGIADGHDGRPLLVDASGHPVARLQPVRGLATAVDADALEGLTRGGVRGLATIAAVRFVPWFAEAVQRRPAEREPITFVGGEGVNAYGIVAAKLGMDPAKHAINIRGMLHAMQATIVSYPDGGEAGLLMLDYRPGGGRGNLSRLTLTPGRPWWASDVHDLPPGAEYRALAPIPKLEGYAPPFVGDPSERAALARLYLRILAELARDAPDLARGLGAHIPVARWMELAIEVGVKRPPPLLTTLLSDRWTRDGDDGAAILERVGPDRWHLAPRFEAERAMLEAGGRKRIGAAEGGRRSSKGRADAADRLASKGRGKGGRSK